MSEFKWTPVAMTTLYRMWHDGKTLVEIAALLGTTKGSVSGKVRRLGIHRSSRDARFWNLVRIEELKTLRSQDGITLMQIAKHFGKSQYAIRQVMTEHGIERLPYKRSKVDKEQRREADRRRRARRKAERLRRQKELESLPPMPQQVVVENRKPEQKAAFKPPAIMLGPDMRKRQNDPTGCRYIAGDPKVDPTNCGKVRKTNSSYCEEHHKLCYYPPKVRWGAAA